MNLTVEPYMTKKPFTLKLPASVSDAMQIMASKDVAAVPVTDPKGNYAGIVSRRDILEHPKEDELSLLMRTDLPTLTSKDTLDKAVGLFTKILRRHLVIVDNKKISGIITPYDLLDAVISKKVEIPISKLVTRNAIPLHIKSTAKMVERVIKLTKITAFPVLDNNGNLVGLVTERDLLNGANLDSKTVSTQLGIGEDDDAWSWESLRDIYTFYYTIRDLEIPNVEVEKIMVKNPISIFEGASAYDAARIMKKNKFTQLPVRDVDDELSGMVYDFDIISSLIK
ncbi:MAG: CBS domain-containing protein [Candidatus Thermoplasmatota archaeon]|jgi:CBS domain-containing protein|nr:CBS domain-containing protein [Candidatus Thermoplasmatota archaeon]